MACLKLPVPPPIPPLGPIGLPSFSLPPLNVGINLCCKFNFSAFLPIPPLPPIPIVGAILAEINAFIALIDEVLDFLDQLALSCPLDDVSVNV